MLYVYYLEYKTTLRKRQSISVFAQFHFESCMKGLNLKASSIKFYQQNKRCEGIQLPFGLLSIDIFSEYLIFKKGENMICYDFSPAALS